MPRVIVQRSKKRKKLKTRMKSKTLLLSQPRVWKGLPFLMEEPRRPFLDSRVFNQLRHNTTVETTDVGLAFAGGETEAASKNIWIPDAEFPQGISLNVVSNESTPFLSGLDVIREHGFGHRLPLQSCLNIMKRDLPCAILPTGHLALEMMPRRSEKGERSESSHSLSTRCWGQQPKAQEKQRFHLNHPHFTLEKGSQNASTNTHPTVMAALLLKLLGVPDDTQTWPLRQESENLSHHLILGTFVGECYDTDHG